MDNKLIAQSSIQTKMKNGNSVITLELLLGRAVEIIQKGGCGSGIMCNKV